MKPSLLEPYPFQDSYSHLKIMCSFNRVEEASVQYQKLSLGNILIEFQKKKRNEYIIWGNFKHLQETTKLESMVKSWKLYS